MKQFKSTRTTSIRIEKIEKSFGDLKALQNINLYINRGEFFTLLGPSGCGKTTLLRTIAGFEKPDSGSISFGDKNIIHLPAWERNIGFVFQNYALWPNMTILQNIAYGLKLREIPSQEIKKQVKEVLDIVSLPGIENKFPEQLSGGQQQRVAIARAIVIDPQMLLLDEPLSNLDAKLRVSLRKQIREIQKRLGFTVIYVTHDQEEALEISDRIAVMDKGRILQIGGPEEIYEDPIDNFVADFIGKANFIKGKVTGKNLFLSDSGMEIKIDLLKDAKDSTRVIMVRPEQCLITLKTGPWHIYGTVVKRFYLGNIIRYFVKIGEKDTILIETREKLKLLDTVYISFNHYKVL